MSTVLQEEWDYLMRRIQENDARIEHASQELAALNATDAVRLLREQRERQIAALEPLQERLDLFKTCRGLRIRAARNNQYSTTLAARAARKRRRAELVQSGPDAPADLVESVQWSAALYDQSIEELQRLRAACVAEVRRREQDLDELQEKLCAIRRSLTAQRTDAKEERRALTEELQSWATCDRAHLEWFLAHAPAPREPMLRSYLERHAASEIPDILERYGLARPPAPPAHASSAGTDWRFVFLETPQSTKAHVLPPDRDFAVTELAALLRQFRIWTDAAGVISELRHVIEMPVQNRCRLKKIIDAFPLGWSIQPIGNKFRAFLNIKEEERVIEFVVVPRRDAYRNHDTIAHLPRKRKKRRRR